MLRFEIAKALLYPYSSSTTFFKGVSDIPQKYYNSSVSGICELSDQPWSDTFSQAAGRLYKNAVFPATCVTASITLGSFLSFVAVLLWDKNTDYKVWYNAMEFFTATIVVYSFRDLIKNSAEIYIGKDNVYSMAIDISFSAAAHAARVPIYQDDFNMIKIGVGWLDGFLYSSMAYFDKDPVYGRYVQMLGAQSVELLEYMVDSKLSPAAIADFSNEVQNIGGLLLGTLFIDLSLADKNNFWYEYQQSVVAGVNKSFQFIKTIPTVINNIVLINLNATHDTEVVEYKPDKKTVAGRENGGDIQYSTEKTCLKNELYTDEDICIPPVENP